ncbi:MAG: DNA cytosine methyltransferase [Proteobacteria bacterium]|nr:DNA cytosine methyltransferase [Pseudomonadota bacterium]
MSFSPSFVDVFCGAGGLSLGLIQAGWRPLLALDHWKDAIDTYKHNLNRHESYCLDIRNIGSEDLCKIVKDRPDWVVGGPPCQGFSTVGKRKQSDPRNFLVEEFARVASILKPKHILIENVLGLRDMKFITYICELFERIGYQLTPILLSAADFGVPQLRRRVFFVGDCQEQYFYPPLPTHCSADYVTVRDAIGDLPELESGQCATEYVSAPQTGYQYNLRLNSNNLQGHVASRHPDHLVKTISFIPDGGNRRHIPDEYQPKSGFHNSYSRLHSASPAVAVTQNMGKPSGTRCIHPHQNRGLTAREGARLQGFPDTFHFLGGITSQRLQIANAVPPILARTLAAALDCENNWGCRPPAIGLMTETNRQLELPI